VQTARARADKQGVQRSRAVLLTWVVSLSGCFELPDADLVGPTITAASLQGPRSVELSVMPELVIELSEPMDPASIHAGSVVLIAWEQLDSCALTPLCEQGSCERGTCQQSPLGSGDRSALDRGELDPLEVGGEALEFELGAGAAGAGTRLLIRPRRPLASHRRYSLVLGAAVRDRSGAPLVDEHGRVIAWQRDFVTAGRGSGGPEPRLVAPMHGQVRVPSNVAAIDIELWPPVPMPSPDAVLWLEPQEPGELLELIDPTACPGWVTGTCLRWRPAEPLTPNARYRPAGGTFLDRHGRAARLPAAMHETWFTVGSGPDLDAPLASATAQMRGRCLAVWVDAGELVDARLQVGSVEQRATIAEVGWIGLAIAHHLDPEQSVAWSLELRDLADNQATLEGETPAGSSFAEQLPRMAITEILANPSGPEPAGEFIELRAGPDGASLDGVYLADASLAEIRDAWADGDTLGDPLPAIELGPEELAIVVGTSYGAEPSEDPLPPASVRVITVDASLGAGGLKNVGERVTLWAQTEHGPAAIASYGNWIETDASAHEGRSVIASADGCDLPDRWRSHPFGRSTPGTLP
jgi:hypothetical protein